MTTKKAARIIAFYLPQFHPIPENDLWWGKGFTEWTNVANAKPLFRGHYQPRLPADLGFYDLRVPETRIAQAELAKSFGIEGFCYWHYWFAGKRLLERPFTEVLESGEPNFPFCLGWANDSWTGIWHGCPDRILIEQRYPGIDDCRSHFMALLKAFSDDRYITVKGKPIFVIYNPQNIPDPIRYTDQWRDLAIQHGLKGLYFIGISNWWDWFPIHDGFDGWMIHNPGIVFNKLNRSSLKSINSICRKIVSPNVNSILRSIITKPRIIDYKKYMEYALPTISRDSMQFPCVVPNWDNTPRSGKQGYVFVDASPRLFQQHFRQAVEQVVDRDYEMQLVFIKSWNEWAEGNYLEPDQEFGNSYLKAIETELSKTSKNMLAN